MNIIAEQPPSLPRPTPIRYYVLAALLVITAINYAQRNSISPAATTIEAELGVTPIQLDAAMSAFFLAYTLLQVPSGKLAQRWGSRLVLPLYAAGWSLALVVCALAWGFPALYGGRLLMGALQAGIFPCCTLILSVWCPASRRGLASALLNSFMLIGGAAGSTLASYLLEPVGWRAIFLGYAVPGLLWSAWFLWWFRDDPSEHPGVNRAERELLPEKPRAQAAPGPREGVAWVVVLTSLPLLLLCGQQAFRAGANRLFDSRLPTYLEQQRGLSKTEAGVLATYPQWAMVVGSVCGGALSDWVLRRTGRRRLARNGVAILSILSATAVYLSAWFVADVYLAAWVLSAGAFLFTFSSPCAYALSIDIGGRHLPVVFGMMNMIGNLGAWAFISCISFVVEFGGWTLLLGLWLAMHLAAAALWLFLDPNVVIGEVRRPE